MKNTIPLFVTLVSAISIGACADVNVIDEGKTSGIKVTEITFGKCHIKLADPLGGDVDQTFPKKAKGFSYQGSLYKRKNRGNDFGIKFTCQDSSKETIVVRSGAVIENKQWRLATAEEKDSSDEDIRDLKTTLITFSGKGWHGAGNTQDQNFGEPELRVRSFTFCIPHNDVAVCGSVESVANLNNLKESAMPNIIKLLEGLEFIDDAPAQ